MDKLLMMDGLQQYTVYSILRYLQQTCNILHYVRLEL